MEAAGATAPAYQARPSAAARVWKWLRDHGVNVYAGLAIAYLLIPIAVIIFFSFNNPAGKYNFTWVGFTLEHWQHVFSLPDLNEALLTSLRLALFATVISTAIGTAMALALVRYQFFGRRTANFLIVIPMATPEVVMGASLLSFFLVLGTRPRRERVPDVPAHHPAADHARHPRRRPARLRALDRRFRRLELQLGDDGD